MRVRNRFAVAAAMIAILGSTTGCKKLLAKLKKSDAGAAPTTATHSQDDADESLQEKVDEYIRCLNSLSSPIHQSRHRYLSYVPRSGPTGRESSADLDRIPSGATAKCQQGITKAKAMPPADPKLESAGDAFAASAVAIDKLITDADRYYENKDFRDDKWAKGRALHPQLMSAWATFSKADKELHETVHGITKPLALRVLGRIEREDGKKFFYHRKKTIITARELVEASDPIGEDDDIDFALYGAAYTDFEKALDELQEYGSAHKADLSDQQQAPSWPMADNNYDSFVQEAGEFKKAAKEFWRCLRDAPAKAKTPSGKLDLDKIGRCQERSAYKQADEVVTQYNEFIRTSNQHQFP